jgi:hypothetical protein
MARHHSLPLVRPGTLPKWDLHSKPFEEDR